jgi:VanZ family protein
LLRRVLDGYCRLSRWLRVALAVLWMAVLWWLTDRPSADLPVMPVNAMVMNGAHVVAFGILAALLFLAGGGRLPPRCLWSVGLTALYGVATELNQAFGASGRTGDPWDVASDAVGGMLFTCGLVWARSGSGWAFWLAAGMVPLALLTTTMAS